MQSGQTGKVHIQPPAPHAKPTALPPASANSVAKVAALRTEFNRLQSINPKMPIADLQKALMPYLGMDASSLSNRVHFNNLAATCGLHALVDPDLLDQRF